MLARDPEGISAIRDFFEELWIVIMGLTMTVFAQTSATLALTIFTEDFTTVFDINHREFWMVIFLFCLSSGGSCSEIGFISKILCLIQKILQCFMPSYQLR